MLRALVLALAACILIEAVVIVPRLSAFVLIATIAWLVLPGIVLFRHVFESNKSTAVGAWLVGPALGLGFSVFGAFAFWAAGVQNWIALIVGPALPWSFVVAARRWGVPSLRLPAFSRRDIIAVVLTLMIVPLVTWAPYDHVREPVVDGQAYRAYFTADFIWAMTVTS